MGLKFRALGLDAGPEPLGSGFRSERQFGVWGSGLCFC